MIHARIGPDEVAVLSMMLDNDSVQPGQLFPLHHGHGASVCNAMMFDKFHGHGWKLNFLTGWFEKDVVQCKRYRDWETDRKSTRLNSSHSAKSRMPSSA